MGGDLRKRQGFTLIELLVSLSIFSIISLAVYSSFAGGIGAWRKAQEFSSVYQTSRLLLDDMARELKNTVKITGSKFEGGPRSLSFVTVNRSPYLRSRPEDYQVHKVSYELRRGQVSSGYALYRRKAANLKNRVEAEMIVDSLESLDLQYTYKDSEGNLKPWTRVWNVSDEVPFGVKIDLSIGGTQFTKMVVIPHGFQEQQKK